MNIKGRSYMLVNSGNLRVKADILSISPMSEPMAKG